MVFDDSNARKIWNWQPKHDLPSLVVNMINALKAEYGMK